MKSRRRHRPTVSQLSISLALVVFSRQLVFRAIVLPSTQRFWGTFVNWKGRPVQQKMDSITWQRSAWMSSGWLWRNPSRTKRGWVSDACTTSSAQSRRFYRVNETHTRVHVYRQIACLMRDVGYVETLHKNHQIVGSSHWSKTNVHCRRISVCDANNARRPNISFVYVLTVGRTLCTLSRRPIFIILSVFPGQININGCLLMHTQSENEFLSRSPSNYCYMHR